MTLVLGRELQDKASLEMSCRIEAELGENATAGPRPAPAKLRGVSVPADTLDISFVVPVRDAEATLIELYQRIVAALPGDMTFEILLIDDGSRDRSWEVIGIMARCEPATVRGLRLRSRVGKATALATGFRVARGKIIFTLSADFQNDLSEISRMLDKLGEGYDLVSGSIKDRHDLSGTFFPIRIFYHMRRGILRVLQHEPECGLKCWRYQVARKLMIFAEPHWMVRDPAELDGFHVAEIEVERPPRRPGLSKHGFKQSIRDII
jgi:dolichol-phosphate mannosyltransferase